MQHNIAVALVLTMFAVATGLTILNLIAIYEDTTIEGLFARFKEAIDHAINEHD